MTPLHYFYIYLQLLKPSDTKADAKYKLITKLNKLTLNSVQMCHYKHINMIQGLAFNLYSLF